MENFALDPHVIPLLEKETIAGAVAREAHRAALYGYQYSSDGIAYKAAWDRRGSGAHKHIEAARADSDLIKANILSGSWLWCDDCATMHHSKWKNCLCETVE